MSKARTFPEPKNPVIIVAGIRLSGGIFVDTSELSSCDVGAVAEEAAAAANLLTEPFVGLATSLAGRNDDVVKLKAAWE